MSNSSFSCVSLAAALILLVGCVSPPGPRGSSPEPEPLAAGQPGASQGGLKPRASSYPSPGANVDGSAKIRIGQPLIGQVSFVGDATQGCGCSNCPTTAADPTIPCAPQAAEGCAVPTICCWNTYGTDPQEFLCDGGDHDLNARLRRDDSIVGLDPEDTIVHYTTEAGNIEIEASNRVCVYAPRFGSVRKVTGAIAGGRAVTASQVDRPQGPNALEHDLPGLVVTDTAELGHADVASRVDAIRDRNRGVPVESILQPLVADDVLAALAGITALNLNELQEQQKLLLEKLSLAAVAWTLDEAVEVTVEDLKPPTLTRDENVAGLTIFEFPDAGRLRICKLADRQHAAPGEIVNFSIQVVNVGDSPVNHVTITDNLTTRLEYLPDSQTCSAGAEFKSVENASQSLQLTWALTDQLQVGESATIRFRCRVR